ncbi:DUF6476 family protein [Gemmobacter serpentinus]|uniref:DUF6476 family protein n=1 Tax=Gemmobacter serpentinus TaxID=2652247 RepID=UPI00124D2CBA|nr:DUF6476 family protein [Gemmobacter serpentinus]
MDDTSEQLELPPSLRWLKWLVTALTLTLILGVITIVGLLVTRLPLGTTPAFPENLTLPEGVSPQAITRGKGWVAVVTDDGRILIFDTNGQMTQEIAVNR